MNLDLKECEIKFIHDILLDYINRNVYEENISSKMQTSFDILNKMKKSVEKGMYSELRNNIDERYVLGFVDDEDETWCFVDLDSNYTTIG
jgi:hypothetical protein